METSTLTLLKLIKKWKETLSLLEWRSSGRDAYDKGQIATLKQCIQDLQNSLGE